MKEKNMNLSLKGITDKQGVALMKLAYLDFDIEKFEKLKMSGQEITVSNLEQLLVNPNISYLGISEDILNERVRKR